MQRGAERIGLTWAADWPYPRKSIASTRKPCSLERHRLLLPTLLVETATVSKHNPPVPIPVQIGVDEPAVPRRESDVLLRGGESRQENDRNHHAQSKHASSVTPGSAIGDIPQGLASQLGESMLLMEI